jgi:hypothetical protein
MLPDKKIKCPYTGFTKTCFDGVVKHSCPKWIHVAGVDPNTGNAVDRYDCSDAWIPALLIENSQQQRQTGSAVESFRNIVVGERAAQLSMYERPKMIELN